MSGETEKEVSGWTVDTLAVHLAALREADLRAADERDRRYAEVSIERAKALEIDKAASAEARLLQRESQTYKDEQANRLREQINSERGNYASHTELTGAIEKVEEMIKPLTSYVAAQQGVRRGADNVWKYIFATAGFLVGLIGIVIALFVNSNKQTSVSGSPPQQVIYIPTTPAAVTPKAAPTP